MKKIVLSMAAAATLGSFAMAGGDVTPPPPAADVSGIYFGMGFAYNNIDVDDITVAGTNTGDLESDNGSSLWIAGYQYNEWLSFEGRLTYDFNDFEFNGAPGLGIANLNVSLTNIGLYAKPHYTFGDFTAYALLGFGWTVLEVEASAPGATPFDDSFTEVDIQWGAGLSYALSEHTSVFVDYTQFYSGSGFDDIEAQISAAFGTPVRFDVDTYAFNVGMTYKF